MDRRGLRILNGGREANETDEKRKGSEVEKAGRGRTLSRIKSRNRIRLSWPGQEEAVPVAVSV